MTYPIFKINAFMMKNLTITIFKSTLSLMGFIALATTQLVVGIGLLKYLGASASVRICAFFMSAINYDLWLAVWEHSRMRRFLDFGKTNSVQSASFSIGLDGGCFLLKLGDNHV